MSEQDVKNNNNRKKNFMEDKWWLWAIGAVVVFAFIIGLSGTYRNILQRPLDEGINNGKGGINNIIKGNQNDDKSKTNDTNNQLTSGDLKSYIQQNISSKLTSDTGLGTQNKLRQIVLNPDTNDSTPKDVTIDLNITDTAMNTASKDQLLSDIKNIISFLKHRQDVKSLTINEYMSVKDSNESPYDKKVFSISIPKSKIDSVDWDNATEDIIRSNSTSYEIDPILNK